MKLKRIYFSSIVVLLTAMVLSAQDTQRPRPERWNDLVPGGRFMDLFEPVPLHGALTSETWGVDAVKPRDVSLGIEDKDWSYWGGNILKGEDGLYHLFVCRWPENHPKGHMAWPDSEVVHTVSTELLGPYKPVKVIGKGHNPEVYQLADGSYVLYVIDACYRSSSLNGPWKKGHLQFNSRGRRIVEGLSNLTFARREDGSVLMICRGGGVWISQDGNREFNMVSPGSVYPRVEGRFEDPVVWRDHVQYHLIVNDWYGRIAYHLRSPNGVRWKVDSGEAYVPGIDVYEDGTKVDWYKYERLKVVQDRYGRATHANFAVIDYSKFEDKPRDIHSSKNIIIPLTVGRLLTILNEEKITPQTKEIRLKIEAEEGFLPSRDVDVTSLRFGAPEEVDYGRGATPLRTETSGDDLIVVFEGRGNGLTDDNFTTKLLGRDAAGKLLFGYARLPWLSYNDPILSATAPKTRFNNDGSVDVDLEVENYGQVDLTEGGEIAIDLLDRDNEIIVGCTQQLKGLKPFETMKIEHRFDRIEQGTQPHICRVTLCYQGRAQEVLDATLQ